MSAAEVNRDRANFHLHLLLLSAMSTATAVSNVCPDEAAVIGALIRQQGEMPETHARGSEAANREAFIVAAALLDQCAASLRAQYGAPTSAKASQP